MLTDVTAADRMMSRFSDLLRMTLEDGAGHVTTLSRELEFVSGYLEIEKVRFGDRLSVTIDFAPDTLDAEVPHLLLQPLVENAVRHGIAKLSSKGEIRMTSRREGNSLHLIVSDNGPGFVSPGEPRLNGGVGLRATLERLNTLYGDTQSLRIRNGRDGGAEISVLIPFRPVLQQA
jgi:LytS/YehU family sensor histidine kinase